MLSRQSLRERAPHALALMLAGSGVVHMVRPQTFEPIVPRALPSPRAIVYLSGLAELACAIGLLVRAPWSRFASATLLVAVLPANVQMALDESHASPPRSRLRVAAIWLRIPLQAPLIWAALQHARAKDG